MGKITESQKGLYVFSITPTSFVIALYLDRIDILTLFTVNVSEIYPNIREFLGSTLKKCFLN